MADIGSYILAGSQGLASGIDKLGTQFRDAQEREQAQQLLTKLGLFNQAQNPIPNAQPAVPNTLASLGQPSPQPIAQQNPGNATTAQLPPISPSNRPVAQGFANEMGQKWAQSPGKIGGNVPALAGLSAPSYSQQSAPAPQREQRGGVNPQGPAQAFLGTLQGYGLTNPNALAAVGATGYHESRWSPDKIAGSWSDPSQSGQPGTSGGALSWRAERLAALRNFAASRGEQGNGSLETQAQFFMQENPGLIQKLNSAQSPQEAMQYMNDAWRFAGYNKPGGEAAARMVSANQWAGTPPSQAQTNPLANVAPMGGSPAPQQPQTLAQLSTPPQQSMDMGTLAALMTNKYTAPIGAQIIAKQLGRDPVQMQMQLIELQKAQMGLQNAPLQQQMFAEQLRAAQLGNQRTQAELSGEGQKLTYQDLGDSIAALNQRGEIVRTIPKSQTATLGEGQQLVNKNTGQVIAGGDNKPKLTESQSKDLSLYQRGAEAENLLRQNEGVLASGWETAKAAIPGAGNYLASESYQKARQAGREVLAAILRKDTGAAVTKQEEEIYGKMYLPQPGDTPQVIEQKRQARQRTLEANKLGLGKVEGLATARIGQQAKPLDIGKSTEIDGVKIQRIR